MASHRFVLFAKSFTGIVIFFLNFTNEIYVLKHILLIRSSNKGNFPFSEEKMEKK